MPFEQFRNLYPVQKTVCVPIEPTEATRKVLTGNLGSLMYKDAAAEDRMQQILARDLQLLKDGAVVHEMLDDVYKGLIYDTMVAAGRRDDVWARMVVAFRAVLERGGVDKDSPEKQEFNAAGNEACRLVMDTMAAQPKYESAVNASRMSALFNEVLIPMAAGNRERYGAVTRSQNMKQTFTAFVNGRSVILGGGKEGSVAYRAVWQNGKVFAKNIIAWDRLLAMDPSFNVWLEDILNQIGETDVPLAGLFSEGAYGRFLTQRGIEAYNAVINGWTEETAFHKGLRGYINEYTQQHDLKNVPQVEGLFKQILSEREGFSFRAERFEDDREVWEALTEFFRDMQGGDIAARGARLMASLPLYDAEKITFAKDARRYISNGMFGPKAKEDDKAWKKLDEGLAALAWKRFPGNKKKRMSFLGQKRHTLADLEAALLEAGWEGGGTVVSFLAGRYAAAAAKVEDAIARALAVKAAGASLSQDKTHNNRLRIALEDIKEGRDVIAMFCPREEKDGDPLLMDEAGALLAVWNRIVPLLSGTRAYCTTRPRDAKKVRLYFGNDTLMDGFSIGLNGKNLKAKGGMIVRIDGAYHVIVIRKGHDVSLDALVPVENEPVVDMMCLDKVKVAMQITRMIFTEKAMDIYGAPDDVREVVLRGGYKGKADAEDLRKVIAYAQSCFDRHPSFRNLGLPVKDPVGYPSWKAFVDDLDEAAYRTEFRPVSRKALKDLEEKGSVLVFRMAGQGLNNVYRGRYTGKVLVRNLVDAINGDNNVRINSAKVYYRGKSAKEEVTHPVGSYIVNRRTISGESVPEDVHRRIYEYVNGRGRLAPGDKAWLDSLGEHGVKKATIALSKDRRYMMDHYELQVALTLGASARPESKNLREMVNGRMEAWLTEHPRCRILGINRGENNLIYATLVDADGTILEQRGFNVVGGTDYHFRIAERVKKMAKERDTWQDMDSLDDIKTGYLSAALSEIVGMAFRNEAVIVMEDLDTPFLESRSQMGQTVYRKFRTMLLNKLRWYVPDKTRPWEAWQLSSGETERVKGARKENTSYPHRNGIVFFVSPWATSDLDPVTGFRPMLPTYNVGKADEKRKLFAMMEAIRKNADGDYEFTFDYNKFDVPFPGYKTRWTVSSRGERLIVKSDDKGNRNGEIYRPTEHLDNALRNAAGEVPPCGADLYDAFTALKGDSLDEAFLAFVRVMQVRNCDVGARTDWFASPVASGFDSRAAKDTEPWSNDAVTAYNLATKARYCIENGLDDIDNARWLEIKQR